MSHDLPYRPAYTQAEIDSMVADAIAEHPNAQLDTELINNPELLAEVDGLYDELVPYMVHLVMEVKRKSDARDYRSMTNMEVFVFRTAPDINKHLFPPNQPYSLILAVLASAEMTLRHGHCDPKRTDLWQPLVAALAGGSKKQQLTAALLILRSAYPNIDTSDNWRH